MSNLLGLGTIGIVLSLRIKFPALRQLIPSSLDSITPALLIAVLPLLEYAVFRLFTRYALKIKVGFVGMTDADLLFPGFIAYLLLMRCFAKEQKPVLRLNKGTLALNICLCVLLLALDLGLAWKFGSVGIKGGLRLRKLGMPLLVDTWNILAFSTLLSSCFVFLHPSYFLKHPQRYLVIPALLLGLSKIIGTNVFGFLWQPTAHFTGLFSYALLKPSGVSYEIFMDGATEYTHLTNQYFTLAIGEGCSGLEGMSFFFLLVGFCYLVIPKRFSPLQWLSLLFAGLVTMYFANLARIVTYFHLSSFVYEAYGEVAGVYAALTLFHDVTGWLMYFFMLWVFIKYLLSRGAESRSRGFLREQEAC